MQLDYSLCNNVHDSQYGHYTQRNWLCWLMAVRGIIRIYGQVFITWKPSHDCYFTVFLTDDVLLICVISSRDQLNSLPILAHHRYFFLHDITVYSFCTCNAMIYLQHIKNVHVLSSHEVSSAHHKKKRPRPQHYFSICQWAQNLNQSFAQNLLESGRIAMIYLPYTDRLVISHFET